ncbi:RNA 2',3'-cyclic phosphodiesterase [Vibrio sp. YIC-376]|uniref:RNA 2',3'-cyclic phosphodiesterase n=1 Tax=Vibrio sp. YIC-376 TaxID=3136162 RepID=UPI00402ABC89
MRLFFALTFDDSTKNDLAAYQDLVRKNGMEGHNTRKENFHLTLTFIGECTEQEKQTLIDILHQLKSGCDTLRIDRLGSFHQKRSHLLWMGLANNRALMRLQSELKTALLMQNFVTESRSFIPHITLFRHVSDGTQLKSIHITPRNIHVYSIALMESMYRENKLVYQVLDEVIQ